MVAQNLAVRGQKTFAPVLVVENDLLGTMHDCHEKAAVESHAGVEYHYIAAGLGSIGLGVRPDQDSCSGGRVAIDCELN